MGHVAHLAKDQRMISGRMDGICIAMETGEAVAERRRAEWALVPVRIIEVGTVCGKVLRQSILCTAQYVDAEVCRFGKCVMTF